MEVKKGYKQTEVGIIPEDWGLIDFDSVFDFLSTASYSRAELSKDENIKYIHYGYIHTKWDYFLDLDKNDLPTIGNDKAKNYSFINEGDLIMADASEDYEGVGKSVEVKNVGINKVISGLHTFLLRDKKNIFVNGFKGYIYINKFVKNQFDRLATGLKVYGVSKKNLKIVQIPYPISKVEQTAIATVLSDTDELITSLDKLIEKKQNIKQGTMQQLLTGKKRLPGFSGEWEVKKLGKIFCITAGGDLNKTDYSYDKDDDYCFPIYSNSLSEEGLYGYSSVFTQKENTITVTARGTVGIANARKYKYSAIGRVIVLNPLTKIDCLFIAEYINNLIDFANESTGVPQLTAPQISKYEIILPFFEEQTAIAKILSDMDSEIKRLENKRDKYKKIKQGMMQELLTGKTRLI